MLGHDKAVEVRQRRVKTFAIIACGTCLLAAGSPGVAQEWAGSEDQPEVYGGDVNYYFVSPEESASSFTSCEWRRVDSSANAWHTEASACMVVAPARLPAGALVIGLEILYKASVNNGLLVTFKHFYQSPEGPCWATRVSLTVAQGSPRASRHRPS